MKKLLSIVLLVCMMLSLLPAGALAVELGDAAAVGTAVTEIPVPEEAVEEAAEEPVEEAAEESVEEPAEEPAEESVEEPAEEPVEEPAEEPVEEPEEQVQDEAVTETAEDGWGGHGGIGGGNYVLDQRYWNGSATVAWTGMDSSSSFDADVDEDIVLEVSLGSQTIPYAPTGDYTYPNGTAVEAASGVSLSDCYGSSTNTSNEGLQNLVIKTAAGYYVTRVVVACCASGGEDPFSCGTWAADAAYESDHDMSVGGVLTIPLASYNFCHSSRDDQYVIVIEVAKSPSTVYVQYFPGTAGTTALNTLTGTAYESTAWMAENSANASADQNGLEYEYTVGSEWVEHTVNSVASGCETVTIGETTYRFSGWKVEYFTTATAAPLVLYSQNLSDNLSQYNSTKASGDELLVFTHARLTALWTEIEAGTLILSKTITVNPADAEGFALADNFGFLVTGPNGYRNYIYYSDFSSGSYTLEGLLPGEYTVVEYNAAVSGFTLESVCYNVNNGTAYTTGSSAPVTVEEGETAAVEFANAYNKNVGDLYIHKHFGGDVLNESGAIDEMVWLERLAGITFTIEGPEDFYNGRDLVITFADFEPNQFKSGGVYFLPNIPVGNYTVTETGIDFDGYTRVTECEVNDHVINSSDIDSSVSASLTLGTNAHNLSFNNSYTRQTGMITVEKKFSGDLTALPEGVDPRFVIAYPDNAYITPATVDILTAKGFVFNDDSDKYELTVSYSSFKGGEYVLEEIPTGFYEIWEVENSGQVTNFALNVSYESSSKDFNPTETTETPLPFVVVTEAEDAASMTITNSYTRTGGDLKITKTFEGLNLEEGSAALETLQDTFTVYVLNAEGNQFCTPLKLDTAVKDGNTYTWTVKDVPYGQYSFSEAGYNVNHYTCTADNTAADTDSFVSGTSFKYQFSKDAAVPGFTNTYENVPEVHVVDVVGAKELNLNGVSLSEAYAFYFKGDIESLSSTVGSLSDEFSLSFNGHLADKSNHSSATLPAGADAYIPVQGSGTRYDGGIEFKGTWKDYDLINGLNGGKGLALTEIDTGNGNWTYDSSVWYVRFEIKGLEETDNGPADEGLVTITPVLSHYDAEEEEISGTYTEIIFTNTLNTISIPVSKTWVDGEDQDGLRPESVTVNLLANGTEVGEAVLNKDNNWSYTFDKLLAYDRYGEAIEYTVTEDPVEGYSVQVVQTDNGIVVTNTHTPATVDVAGSKTWNDAGNQDGLRPESITINLLANGIEVNSAVVEADTNGNWSWSFENLPKYANGEEIEYTVTEDEVDGYTTQVNGYDVTNSHSPATISISGSKVWDDQNNKYGVRPNSITVQLFANGVLVRNETVTEANNWSWSWTRLPVNAPEKVGEEIEYTVKEVPVAAYPEPADDVKEADNGDLTVVITNTLETIELSGKKTWDDDKDRDGLRPDSITINLLANGIEVTSAVVKPDTNGNWSWSFKDLPEYGIDGNKLVYTITEDAVENYATEVNGFNVTNRYTPGKTSVTVSKSWDDDSDRDGRRPESVTVNLLANGSKIRDAVLNEGNNWSYTFTDLFINEKGEKIVYTVEEADVPENYTSAVSGDAAAGFVITNSYTPETVDVSGEKIWDDAADFEGKRPESINVTLCADGVPVPNSTLTVTAENGWAYGWEALPKNVNENGEVRAILYSVAEDAVEGYVTEIVAEEDCVQNVVNHRIYELGFVIEKTVKQTGDTAPGVCSFRFAIEPTESIGLLARLFGAEPAYSLWYAGSKLEPAADGSYTVTLQTNGAQTVEALITVQGTEAALSGVEFTVRELGEAPANWIYDAREYSGSFVFADDAAGVILLDGEGDETEKAAFVNEYDYSPEAPPVVKTGDSSKPGLWALLAVMAAGALALMPVIRRRKNRG